MKSSKITALILCFCLMLSMTACGSNNSTENKTNSNKGIKGFHFIPVHLHCVLLLKV